MAVGQQCNSNAPPYR